MFKQPISKYKNVSAKIVKKEVINSENINFKDQA